MDRKAKAAREAWLSELYLGDPDSLLTRCDAIGRLAAIFI